MLLSELFHHQSKNWRTIACEHVANVFDSLVSFSKAAILHVSSDDQVSVGMTDRIETSLLESKQMADDEPGKLFDDEAQQPLTYDHYYTDNVQKSSKEYLRSEAFSARRSTS